jgi:hypothetical protein
MAKLASRRARIFWKDVFQTDVDKSWNLAKSVTVEEVHATPLEHTRTAKLIVTLTQA